MADNQNIDATKNSTDSIKKYLDFEKPIQEVADKILALQSVSSENPDINSQIIKLEEELSAISKKIYNKLSIWQIVQVARHPERPHTLDYIKRIFSDFDELHGDRQFGDDQSIVGGICYLDQMPVMVIGHEKGRDTEEKLRRNFGMPQPEGYRKAKRLMKLAEQFSLPIINFIDTAGAYPGIEGEERGQNEAIASNLALLSEIKTPVIAIVTGEGGSGGALAISVGDHLSMLEYSTYSVASPEACASIIWRSSEKAPDAAEAMKVSSKELLKLNIIDEIIKEPLGGAHRDYDLMSSEIKKSILKSLKQLQSMPMQELLKRRYSRIISIGS
ncbi:MAG: acetyl-CoA carboxylase carboxyltransferase subunit alpha [Gammaproteobacteria bacterium]